MSQTVNQPDVSPLDVLYAPVRDEMVQVESILRREMVSDYAFVDELVRYGCMLGGKRLRPALLLLTARAVGDLQPSHLTLAAVVEMIHTATLIHDDVLDEATMRRHLATVNARWDSEASVLLGDFLFSHAFYLASTLESTYACRTIGRSTNIVCEGEIRQKGSRANFQLSQKEYIGIIEAKTAELCACCCELGAHYAGADARRVAQFNRFGRDLGIAFQIADDVLDIRGEEDDTGKSLGTDLEKQKPTLPLIRALAVADEPTRAKILSLVESDDQSADRQARLLPYLEQLGAIQYARDEAVRYADNARDQLQDLPKTAARQVLADMCQFVVARSR